MFSTPDIMHSYLDHWAYHEIFGATPALAFWGPNTWKLPGSRPAGMLGIEYWVLGCQPPSSACLMHLQRWSVHTSMRLSSVQAQSLSVPSRDLTFSSTPPPQPQHHVSRGTYPVAYLLPSAVPLFLLLVHSGCTMLPQRRLDHFQTQRQSSSPDDYSNPFFSISPSFTCPPCSFVSRPLLPSRSASTRRRQPLPLPFAWKKTGLQMLPIICTYYKPSNTTLSFMFQRLRRSSRKYNLRSGQTHRFHEIDKR